MKALCGLLLLLAFGVFVITVAAQPMGAYGHALSQVQPAGAVAEGKAPVGINLSGAISLIAFVGSIVLALGRSLWLMAVIKGQVDRIEADFHAHLESPSLHRTPDSEARWTRVETKLDRMEETVNSIRAAVAAKS